MVKIGREHRSPGDTLGGGGGGGVWCVVSPLVCNSPISMIKFQEKGQLISLTMRWEELGAQLSMRRRHPQGFARRSRGVRWRRHVPRDW